MRGTAWLVWLVGCASIAGCAARAPRCARPEACVTRVVPGPCASPASEAAAHPRRDECVRAPWAPEETEAPVLAGLAHRRGEHEREHVLVREGSRPWTAEEIAALRAAHERELFAMGGVTGMGSGLYCGDPTGLGRTLGIQVEVCSHRLDELAAWLAERASRVLPEEATATFCVTLTGAVGPRCERDDPACAPLPYGGGAPAPSCERDRAVDTWTIEHGLSRGSCAYDGECMVSGCGNHCVAWPEAGFAATCEAYLQLDDGPAFCGCTAGNCAWFHAR